ncbi:hypothetical protein BER93_00290 [Xanthomonas fragariae]|nr:hypothetical protein BER92_00285 [Xanthomonas fragariae]AOD16860.1 hypothetical protein BER93_00290 [Xanthomonas fragariae]
MEDQHHFAGQLLAHADQFGVLMEVAPPLHQLDLQRGGSGLDCRPLHGVRGGERWQGEQQRADLQAGGGASRIL